MQAFLKRLKASELVSASDLALHDTILFHERNGNSFDLKEIAAIDQNKLLLSFVKERKPLSFKKDAKFIRLGK